MDKKLHWTQTPEGRRRMALIARKGRKALAKKNGKRPYTRHEAPEVDERIVVYALSHCETWLQVYANGVSVSAAALTSRVAELLHKSSRRSLLGA
jgi:hypothetical protein